MTTKVIAVGVSWKLNYIISKNLSLFMHLLHKMHKMNRNEGFYNSGYVIHLEYL